MATQAQVKKFIENLSVLAIAERNRRDKWVLPSICIAQAALETGWGTSSLMVKANAYFGIKAYSNWKGKVYNANTAECYDGVNYTNITACFRAYDSLAESVADYYDLITMNSRYAGAVNNPDALSAITAIKNGGYATSPTYIEKIMKIVDSYNLTQYDGDYVPVRKTIDELAKEVIAGLWGNGVTRKNKLTNAGYDFKEVQRRVNDMLKSNEEVETDLSLEKIAKEVILGRWGNGAIRKTRLTLAGYNYKEVQALVDRMLK